VSTCRERGSWENIDEIICKIVQYSTYITFKIQNAGYVSDRDIRSKLARPTHLLGFSLDIKSRISVWYSSAIPVILALVVYLD
jgi:hypothetical protein